MVVAADTTGMKPLSEPWLAADDLPEQSKLADVGTDARIDRTAAERLEPTQ